MPKICPKCGREGDPNNLFCGMCGKPLFDVQMARPPAHAVHRAAQELVRTATMREPAPSLSGFSMLGLSENPPEPSPTYLLEDDATSSHWGRRLILFAVLLAGAAIAAWHWRTQLKELEVKYIQQAPAVQSGTVTYSAQSVSTAGSEVAGTNPNAQVMTSNQPMTNVPSAAETNSPTPNQGQNPAAQSVANAQPEAPAASDKNSTPQTALDLPANPPAKTKASPKDAPPMIDSDAMAYEAEGEKYLYGTGVPQNCSHALQGLTLAAERTNAKAEGVLGTMYATGHCVNPSLPMAYRWFAKALQQDPANTRIERQMQVLWERMTPDERRVAEERD